MKDPSQQGERFLRVHELFRSIQGESTFVGLPCTFVRLAGCHQHCRWCDTPEALKPSAGRVLSRSTVLSQALSFETELIEVTGGEPLLQLGTVPLLAELCDAGRTVLLETSGSVDVSAVDRRVHKIMDLKTPSSGACDHNRFANLAYLSTGDEIKFVLGDRADYEWMCETLRCHQLAELPVALLASVVWGQLDPAQLASWVLADGLPVRVQVQLHKVLWGPDSQGV